jgi:hypothetical protein
MVARLQGDQIPRCWHLEYYFRVRCLYYPAIRWNTLSIRIIDIYHYGYRIQLYEFWPTGVQSK